MAKIPPSLHSEWRRRLAEAGFEDIEDERGNLKRMSQGRLLAHLKPGAEEFYSLLDQYLLENQDIPRLERRILELYAEGRKFDDIAWDVYRSSSYVENKVYYHRDRILHKKP